MADHATTVARYFACVNAEDWEGLEALWHADGEWRAVGARPRVGRRHVIDYFSGLFAPWSTHRDEPVRVILAGDVATVEVRFEGITREGTPVAFDALDVFDFEAGLIRRISNWYDLVYVRQKLAEAAEATAAAAPVRAGTQPGAEIGGGGADPGAQTE
jgi:ketosteroid isomerase-like protein